MATTTNFGWETPDDTDLVKDGAAAMRTLGNSIDASFVDLKGGTSGQVLTKASGTDLDYTWTTPEIGDITAITVTSPITGGGTTGSVGIAIQDATTSVKGAVQLTDSTSSTSTTTAATPNSVKSAYDLANAAIPKSTVTTSGDVIYATGSSTVTRLGIGSTGQVLTVAGGVPTWATPSSAPTLVGVSLTKSAAQSLSNATLTQITWDTEAWDTHGFHDNSTNNQRITIPSGKAGYYQVNAYVGFAANSTGVRSGALRLNGTTDLIGADLQGQANGAFTTMILSKIVSASVGDYYSIYMYQNSGGSLNCIADISYSFFQMTYLGA